MTYTEIFMMLFCAMVLPYLIVGLLALVSIYIPLLSKRKYKPSREALICENNHIKEENKDLRQRNEILLKELNRLRCM